jgi:hypothetical protein
MHLDMIEAEILIDRSFLYFFSALCAGSQLCFGQGLRPTGITIHWTAITDGSE